MDTTTGNSAVTAWQRWREEEDADMRKSHGWLTVISLDFLDETPREVDEFPGLWSVEGNLIRVEFSEGDGVTLDGKPAAGEHKFPSDSQPMPQFTLGSKVPEIALRGGRVLVRVRDDEALFRKVFTGTPTYEYQPQWVVPVTFRPYDAPRTREIFTAQEGLTRDMNFIGEVDIQFEDRTRTLVVTQAPEPFVIFEDLTSGKESALWRRAPLRQTEEGYVVDFNYSHNFPAHYLPFGTCPRPVDENIIDVAIPAGQKKPNETYQSVHS
ncbi:MAG: DUF1684 domain-containing protein [Actinomycetaceae bacterium]|nr:DUF1684 domain-containing protein [Actinomycetaceae bacterium]